MNFDTALDFAVRHHTVYLVQEIIDAILNGETRSKERDVKLLLGCEGFVGQGKTKEINDIINAESPLGDFTRAFMHQAPGNKSLFAEALDFGVKKWGERLFADVQEQFLINEATAARHFPSPWLFDAPHHPRFERAKPRIRVLSLYTRRECVVSKFLQRDGDNAIMTRVLEFLM